MCNSTMFLSHEQTAEPLTLLLVLTCFNAKTNDFNQQTACAAPVHWSKYTTTLPQSHPTRIVLNWYY